MNCYLFLNRGRYPMSSQGSVSHWLEQLQAGNAIAVQPLWERYFQALVSLARAHLGRAARGPADEEDVALSVLDSVCRRAQQGSLPDLRDRDGLWRLLVTITRHKSTNLGKSARRLKRGGGKVQHSSALAPEGEDEASAFANLISREPDPGFAIQVAEEVQRLLALLGEEDQLREVALARMDGDTNEEIAAKLECSVSTVERKLRFIRHLWQHEAAT